MKTPIISDPLFTNLEAGEIRHELVVRHEAHKRIIWACSWNPHCHEFATGSRDKMVKIWAVENGNSVRQLMVLPQFNCGITALSWAGHGCSDSDELLAVGMEDGLIELWSLSKVAAALAVRLDPFLCHVSTVHRLAWRSDSQSEDASTMQLASCGADHSVRVFKVNIR